MKLSNTVGTVERFNTNPERQFKIKATGKAFKALSDTLYSNKIGSIVRELSSNAYDAHVFAGNLHKPFEVHAPSALNNTFIIRDFGPGLSEEDVYGVYTTYFESTKAESNDYVGCFGLGSKSPFSYTDSFLVTSYYNGVKYDYSMFCNEEGEPSVILLGKNYTDEPNGLRVEISVQAYDMSKWIEAIKKNYFYYKVPPIVSGASLEEKVPHLFSEDGYTVYKNSYSKLINVIVGNVCYSVTKSEILNCLTDCYCILDIYCNIGDIEVTLSREGISYTPATIKYLSERTSKALVSIRKYGANKIDEAECMYDAALMFGTYSRLGVKRQYKGIKIPDFMINTDDVEKLGGTVHNFYRTSDNKCRRHSNPSVLGFDRVIFVINDTDRPINRRVINKYTYTYCIEVPDNKVRDLITNKCGILERHWVLASDMPMPNKVVRVTSTKTTVIKQGFAYVFSLYSYKPAAKLIKDIPNPAKCLYITKNTHVTSYDGYELNLACTALRKQGYEVYKITNKYSENEAIDAGWTSIEEWSASLNKEYFESAYIKELFDDAAKKYFNLIKDKDVVYNKIYKALCKDKMCSVTFLTNMTKHKVNDIKKEMDNVLKNTVISLFASAAWPDGKQFFDLFSKLMS